MDSAQPWLLTFVVSVVAAAYLLLAARARSSGISRRQSQVRDDPPNNSLPKSTKNQTRKRLTTVYPEQTRDAFDDVEVDIVAVHGLGSDANWSWIYKDGEKHVNWLRDSDMLPAKVPKAKIIVYRYESTWHADAPKTRLQLCGEELIHSLYSFRASHPRRPLIFIGHSLGGNVILQALLYASDDSRYASVLKTTVGLVFLGTPFRGSKWQPLANVLAQLMGPAGSHRGITRELGFDEPALRDRLHRFCKLRNKLSTAVACFSELQETDYGRRLGIAGLAKGMVVEETSACIPGFDRYALNKNHLMINKYDGPNDPAFERVSDVISEMCRGAYGVVQRRFQRREVITDNHAVLRHNAEAGGCLHDLFVTDPLEDKKALKRKKGRRAAGTCEWILGTEHLTAWLGPSKIQNAQNHSNQVLWLHGNPGTGKSTLAIYLTDELSTDFSATDGKMLAYFFCDSAFDTRRTATSVVRGLLLQLVQQHPPLLSYVLPKYSVRKAKLFDSFDALWEILISAAADKDTGQKYLVIDALDECDADSQKTLLYQLRDTFHGPDAPSNVRILVTSRPYPEIRNYLGGFTCLDFACFPDAKRDIDQCIKERVAQLPYTEKIKGSVTEILKYKAAGTFLWVGIACNELEDIPSKDAISFLEAMPSGLHALYERLFSAALEKETEQDTIRLILGFVAVSQRPLTILELSEACRLRQDEADVETRTQFMREHIESCRLMVVIQDEKVLLLHQSVKDYLVKAGDKACFGERQAHADLAYRCLDHIIEHFRHAKRNDDHFLDYATREWPNHAHLAQSKFGVMASQAEFFKIISPCRESWLAAYRDLDNFSYGEPSYHFSVLHLAARWGIPAIVEHVFSMYDQYDTAEGSIHLTDVYYDRSLEPAVARNWEKGQSPLHWASENGHVEVVKLLLQHKTHPLSLISGTTKLTTDIDHMTALHYTVSNGSEEMAQYFLDAGISVDTGVRRRIWSEARCVSHDSDDSVVDCSSRRGLTALHHATLIGSKRMAKFLLDRGADPNVMSEHNETPLHLAIKRDLCGPKWPASSDRWNDPVYRIEQALDNIGYDPEDEDEFGETWDLIEQHRLSVLTLLLNKDSTDVNAKDMYGASPLHCVIFENIKAPKIIELLIERGADVSARNDQGQTALHLACSQGSLCSVIALVERGSDVTIVDLQGLNAIHYAAQSRNTDLVGYMINLCPTTLVAARDKCGRNALHHLVGHGWHVEVDAVEYLMFAGASVEDLDNKGLSPLALYLADSLPLLSGTETAVGLLLQHGSDPSFQTIGEKLNLAHLHANKSSKINIEVLETLREFGVSLEEKDNEGRTLLHHCAIGGSLTELALQFLCDEVGLDMNVRDTHGKVPLQYATEERQKKRDPDIFDSDRWSRTEKILLSAP